MPLARDFFEGAEARYGRFEGLFAPIDRLITIVNTITTEYRDTLLRLSRGDGRQVSLIVATSFGKTLKTFQAINSICMMGYGEDALILLRSNVNLFINTAFLLEVPTRQERVERALDFASYSHREHVKFMRQAFGEDLQTPPPVPANELDLRADRWRQVPIADRTSSLRRPNTSGRTAAVRAR